MGQALYRKYRSKAFSEVVGQEHITTALQQALDKGTVSHAYLFTGPRGVGKTSVARILAHAVNDLPYTDESTHLDIIEIDAASHRRIDEIRELRERVHIAPTSAKYKVYIIDEVHMLTREAFNALLKTLEEPPAHVIFILATTEAHKLPETIISRTQRFTFRPIEETKVIEHLRTLAKAEKITIDDAALQLIARHGGGSFRDSISLLDQVRNVGSQIGSPEVLALLGQAPSELIDSLIQSLAQQDTLAVVQALQTLRDQGYEAARIAKQLGEGLRTSFLAGQPAIPRESLLLLLAKLVDVPASLDPAIALELALLESIHSDKDLPLPTISPANISEPPVEKKADIKPPETTPAKSIPKVSAAKSSKKSPAITLDEDIWPQTLQAIKQKHNTLYGIARMASPKLESDTLTLAFHFAFHQKRLNEAHNRRIIADTIKELTGQDITVTCVLDESLPEPVRETQSIPTIQPDNETVQNISNIFGGAELLQSE